MFKTRTLTALGLVSFGAGFWIWPPMVVYSFFDIIYLWCVWEWSGLLGLHQTTWRLGYLVVGFMLFVATSPFLSEPWILAWVLALWVSLIPWVVGYPRRWPFLDPMQWPGRLVWGSLGILFLMAFRHAMAYLYVHPAPFPHAWFLFLGVWVAAADIGAYLVGKAIGSRPLLPAVSPHKTWEGFWGGLFTFALFWAAAKLYFSSMGSSFWAWMGVGLIFFGLSTLGDLLESALKRSAHIKDSGSLLPGHGGMLDRLDSWIPTAIFLHFFLKGLSH